MEFPSPPTVMAAARKRARVALSEDDGRSIHVLLRSCFRTQSQHNLRAKLNLRRSMMPSPPSSLGLHRTYHATRHFLALTESDPDQMNARWSLLMRSIAQGDKQTAMDRCTGMAERVA